MLKVFTGVLKMKNGFVFLMIFENERNFHSYFLIKCDFSSPYDISRLNKPEERNLKIIFRTLFKREMSTAMLAIKSETDLVQRNDF
jgi:hypothetical protein